MKRVRVFLCWLLVTPALLLAQGCASPPPVPGCDGSSKRPINGRAVAAGANTVEVVDDGCGRSE